MESSSEELRCMDEYLDDDEIELPGFRFHPTDEELVSFYLRRKLDNKPIRIQLIKQIDIYKYDPWDLPKASSTGGEKEWYFYCKRGRKYKNSIRPNRVTGSGFWKATGIDKPVYSLDSSIIIGLKKTLVYYRGSAGKGTKTDWMMHEFRLPPAAATTTTTTNNAQQEAEIWTLCRIFKRNNAWQRKCSPDNNWRHQFGGKRDSLSMENKEKEKARRSSMSSSSVITVESCSNSTSGGVSVTTTKNNNNNIKESYINFGSSSTSCNFFHQDQKPVISSSNNNIINNTTSHYYNNDHQKNNYNINYNYNQVCATQLMNPSVPQVQIPHNNNNHQWMNQPANNSNDHHLFAFEDSWDLDELQSVVQFAL